MWWKQSEYKNIDRTAQLLWWEQSEYNKSAVANDIPRD